MSQSGPVFTPLPLCDGFGISVKVSQRSKTTEGFGPLFNGLSYCDSSEEAGPTFLARPGGGGFAQKLHKKSKVYTALYSE
jgi:hypothetical protein